MKLNRIITAFFASALALVATGCAALQDKTVNAGSQTTALVIEGTPADPATGSGPSGKVIYGDHGSFFHDAPANPGSIWAYHWISYAWIPALFGSNTVSSEVIVMTYGGDGTSAETATRIATRGVAMDAIGLAMTPQSVAKASITTNTPTSKTVTTTDSTGAASTTTTPIAPATPTIEVPK